VDLREVVRWSARPVSSHDFGVAAAIQLADALGKLPPRGRLLGIEIAPCASGPCTDEDAAVQDAIAEVVGRTRDWVVALLRPDG
jgi:hypothetical protein